MYYRENFLLSLTGNAAVTETRDDCRRRLDPACSSRHCKTPVYAKSCPKNDPCRGQWLRDKISLQLACESHTATKPIEYLGITEDLLQIQTVFNALIALNDMGPETSTWRIGIHYSCVAHALEQTLSAISLLLSQYDLGTLERHVWIATWYRPKPPHTLQNISKEIVRADQNFPPMINFFAPTESPSLW